MAVFRTGYGPPAHASCLCRDQRVQVSDVEFGMARVLPPYTCRMHLLHGICTWIASTRAMLVPSPLLSSKVTSVNELSDPNADAVQCWQWEEGIRKGALFSRSRLGWTNYVSLYRFWDISRLIKMLELALDFAYDIYTEWMAPGN